MGPGTGIEVGRLLILVVKAALLCAALLLLWRGLWPARRGSEPRCRRCGYNLTGNVSARCSECGAVLDARQVVYGVRRRRPMLAVVGGVCLLLAVVPILSLSNIQTIEWLPAEWLILNVRTAGGAEAQRALRELERREQNYGLWDYQRRRLVAAALAEQALPPESTVRTRLIKYLGRLYADNRLTAAEEAQLLAQCAQVKLKVRPRVAVGGEVRWMLYTYGRLPGQDYRLNVKGYEYQIDDGPTSVQEGGGSLSGVGGAVGWGGAARRAETLGTHTLRGVMHLEVVWRHAPGAEPQVIHELRLETTETFEVLPPGEVEIKALDKPELADAIRSGLAVGPAEWDGTTWVNMPIKVTFDVTVPLAFDVLIDAGDGRRKIGSLARGVGAASLHTYVSWRVEDGVPPERVDVILRGSEAAAAATWELYGYWAGELVIEDVLVADATGVE